MARERNVEAVRRGIKAAFAHADDQPPTGTQIAAASGVSLSTVNRVLRDEAGVREALDLARASFMSGRGHRPVQEPVEDEDPILANPRAAVRRLEQVIAALIAANEALRRDNSQLRETVDQLREQVRGRTAPLSGRPPSTDREGDAQHGVDAPPRHVSDFPAAKQRARNRRRY